jgi:2,3-bisphosphoglycerate-dependent phosphoglycerate mutase
MLVTQELREARARENLPVELVLLRHAEPDWESAEGTGNPCLTELGRAQAARAASAFRARSLDAIYCSPLTRARETAGAVAGIQEVVPEIIDDLEEIRVPALKNLTQSEVDTYFAAAARRTLQDRWTGFPGGESYRDFHARVTAAVEAMLSHHGVRPRVSEEFTVWTAPARARTLRIGVVGHGGTNAVILAHLLGVPPVPWEWLRFETALAAISVVALRSINVDSYVWSLQRFGWRDE